MGVITTQRLELAGRGFPPIPATGKMPAILKWQEQHGVAPEIIQGWERDCPSSQNTGILTRFVPCVDFDVTDKQIGTALWRLAREHFEERGIILLRVGNAPKFLIPLRTDEPFAKIVVKFGTVTDKDQKIEILGDGQQFIALGVHPDTRREYQWLPKSILEVHRDELPYARLEDIERFTAAAIKLLKECGATIYDGAGKKTNGHAVDGAEHRAAWGVHEQNILDGVSLHDSSTALAAQLVNAQMQGGAAVNFIYSLFDRSKAPRDERWQERRRDVPRLVSSAEAKYGVKAAPAAVDDLTASPPLQADQWPDPHPLPPSLAPVDPFTPDLIPDALQPFVMDTAYRMQCAPEILVAPLMAVLGGVIGTRVAVSIKQHDTWWEYPNQWSLVISDPGLLKSPAMRAIMAPVRFLERQAQQQCEQETKAHEAAMKLHNLRQDRASKQLEKALDDEMSKNIVDLGDVRAKKRAVQIDRAKAEAVLAEKPPEAPKARRFCTSDATYESLSVMMCDDDQAVIVERDELIPLLQWLDREENAMARGFYLTAHSGGRYRSDRIGRGATVVDKACLSIVGAGTPGGVSRYVRAAAGLSNRTDGRDDGGLLARFSIAVWPDVPSWEPTDRAPDAAARELAHQVFARCNTFEPDVSDLDVDPYDVTRRALRADPEATARFITWQTGLEAEIRSGANPPAFNNHISKYKKTVAGLMLVNRIANGRKGPIGGDDVEQAIRLVSFLRSHAVRLYGMVTRADVAGARAIAAKIKAGSLRDGFSFRDIGQAEWSGLTERAVIASGLELLERHHIIVREGQPTGTIGGRPTSTYRINPKAERVLP
jgi:hypothetical protein